MADEIGHRIPELNLRLNADDPATITFTRQGGDYPPGAVLVVEIGNSTWPAVITGPAAVVHATAAMANATKGAEQWRVRLTDHPTDEPISVLKGFVIRDA